MIDIYNEIGYVKDILQKGLDPNNWLRDVKLLVRYYKQEEGLKKKDIRPLIIEKCKEMSFYNHIQDYKRTNKAIDDAKKHYEESNGEYTIINIGNISNLANLKISKVKFTKVEEKLGEINKQTYPGVIWIGWTKEWNSLPYFYNNAPILITKLVD